MGLGEKIMAKRDGAIVNVGGLDGGDERRHSRGRCRVGAAIL